MTTDTHGSMAIAEAHRRLETMKESHKQQMFEEEPNTDPLDPEALSDQNTQTILEKQRHRIISNVCEEVQELFPEPEPEEVRRFRALILTMDTVMNSDDLGNEPTDHVHRLQNIAQKFRGEALGVIESRLVLEEPSDEEDADVIYIYDPVSKVRHTTALGGYREQYDKRMIEDQKQRLAEQILYDPIPDSTPRV